MLFQRKVMTSRRVAAGAVTTAAASSPSSSPSFASPAGHDIYDDKANGSQLWIHPRAMF
jgi:hypothetical protein